jgi:hypothetical protein
VLTRKLVLHTIIHEQGLLIADLLDTIFPSSLWKDRELGLEIFQACLRHTIEDVVLICT